MDQTLVQASQAGGGGGKSWSIKSINYIFFNNITIYIYVLPIMSFIHTAHLENFRKTGFENFTAFSTLAQKMCHFNMTYKMPFYSIYFLLLPKGSEGSLYIWVQRGLNGHGKAHRKTLAPPEGESQGVLKTFQGVLKQAPPVLSSVSAPAAWVAWDHSAV